MKRRMLILRRRVWANLATISIIGMLVVLGFTIQRVVSLSQDGREAHDAICALKGDLSHRIDSSRNFLKDHPNGIPGISALTIQQSIDNQQRTLAALERVKCSTEERKGEMK